MVTLPICGTNALFLSKFHLMGRVVKAYRFTCRDPDILVDDAVVQACILAHRDALEQDGIPHNRFVTDMHPREQDGVLDAAAGNDGAAGDNGIDKHAFRAGGARYGACRRRL